MADVRLSFKEMCAKFDVTPRTLRYYEYIELLSPEKEGRARFYGAREIARMKLILRGRRFGFSLEDIARLIRLTHEGPDACDDISNINMDALELHGDAMAFATSWLSLSTKVIDDEIAAVEQAQQGRALQRQQSVRNIERWGKYFIK